ncbi:SRPBCC family protein [Streptomyces sp. NPDC127197]|uniref:SRPBCC family protein n=1 Tax=Streptomyces sp. NPDC127197 TaxID=3345388 RepID=UPI00362C2C24
MCLTDAPSFEETVTGAAVERLGDAAAIEHYGTENLALGKRITYDVKANWKLIVRNFMECCHCATIHPELTNALPEFANGYAAVFINLVPDHVTLHRVSRLPKTARKSTATGCTRRSWWRRGRTCRSRWSCFTG